MRRRLLVTMAVLGTGHLVGTAGVARAAEDAPKPGTYVVQAGDTLYSIARRHGVKVEALVAANQLADEDVIREGQALTIPGAPATPTPAAPPAVLMAATIDAPKAVQAKPEAPKPPDAPKPGAAAVPRLAWPIALNAPRIEITSSYSSSHRGIDICAPTGHPIKAAAGGMVTAVDKSSGAYGWRLEIDHGNGVYTWYCHLSDFAVAQGEWVKAGQTVGAVGSTGRSTGPHLHLELHHDGAKLDPRQHLA